MSLFKEYWPDIDTSGALYPSSVWFSNCTISERYKQLNKLRNSKDFGEEFVYLTSFAVGRKLARPESDK